MSKIRVAGLIENSTVDGPGFRTVLFMQGCVHRCPGCHNPETWDITGGVEISVEKLADIIMANQHCKAITLSGGEPLLQAEALLELLDIFERHGKNYHVMTFTGFTFEVLLEGGSKEQLDLISRSDLLVDGRFIESEKSLELFYRGSRNQRILDAKESVMLKRAVLAPIGDQI